MILLTNRDIANVLKLSARHVAERVTLQPGFPKPYKVGNSRRWSEKDFYEWLEKQR